MLHITSQIFQEYTPRGTISPLPEEPFSVILLPLRPASLTHKNPHRGQRRKIIHGMSPVGCKDRSINLNIGICRNIQPVHVISVAVLVTVVV